MTRYPVEGRQYVLGGSVRGNAEASADAWPKVLAFLEQARAVSASGRP